MALQVSSIQHENAPVYASAVSSQIVNMFRHVGIVKCLFYIDDRAIVADTFNECNRQLELVLSIIQDIGFDVQESKLQ